MIHVETRLGDIIEFDGDAIVNPANTSLGGGGGLCGLIFQEAGPEKLTEACQKIGYCDFGDAIITPGFKLKAKYIIHTPTPAYGQHYSAEPDILKSCYWESLRRAEESEMKSVAFPMLSTGIHGYPKKDAAVVAFEALKEFSEDNQNSKIKVVMFAMNQNDLDILSEAFKTLISNRDVSIDKTR